MKTIPKFTDLIAEAVRFMEFSKLELTDYHKQIHRYYFKNGYVASVTLWSDNMIFPYRNNIQVAYWYDCNNPHIRNVRLVYDDKDLREYIEKVRDL